MPPRSARLAASFPAGPGLPAEDSRARVSIRLYGQSHGWSSCIRFRKSHRIKETLELEGVQETPGSQLHLSDRATIHLDFRVVVK